MNPIAKSSTPSKNKINTRALVRELASSLGTPELEIAEVLEELFKRIVMHAHSGSVTIEDLGTFSIGKDQKLDFRASSRVSRQINQSA
jgi:nucleoid DNA-binding protein